MYKKKEDNEKQRRERLKTEERGEKDKKKKVRSKERSRRMGSLHT